MMTKHTLSFPVRVYYEDTDAAGIVYYANYLKFAERARTEALRLAGIDQSDLLEGDKIGFVVRRCVVDFLKPARLDDLLTIETELNDISKASAMMHQTVRRGKDKLVTLEVKLAVVDDSGKPVRLPGEVHKALITIFNHGSLF